MKLFLKCLWWNKALGIGWLFIIISILLFSYLLYINNSEPGSVLISCIIPFLLIIGIIIIVNCNNGADTISTYLRCFDLLNKDASSHHFHVTNYWYCNRMGMKWAKYEYNRKSKKSPNKPIGPK